MRKSNRKFCRMFWILCLLQLSFWTPVWGHGRLIEPPSRASAWRYGFNTPPDYNDHESFCGGFTRQWVKNAGRCGLCGDPWDASIPRAHEFGGTFGQGVIVRKYKPNTEISIKVDLTASHLGYFTFALCQDYKKPSESCIDELLLMNANPQVNEDHKNERYYPKEGSKVYEMTFKLPQNVECRHCLIVWRYIAGNNWGDCGNGTSTIGCGPQEEFRACADVSISDKYVDVSTEKPTRTTTITTTTESTPIDVSPIDGVYSPFHSIVIALATFFITILAFFTIYLYFYQIGSSNVKCLNKIFCKNRENNFDNGITAKNNGSNVTKIDLSTVKNDDFPVVPPRNKKLKQQGEEMEEIDLKNV